MNDRTASLEVCEILHTIAGEGSRAGQPLVLVRLSGCNLDCRWCDTPQARRPGRVMSLDDLLAVVQRAGRKLVLLTGGEPLCQPHTPRFCRQLQRAGHEVLLETNGSLDISVLPGDVHVVMDVKLPGSGEQERMLSGNAGRLRAGDEVKLVVGDRDDFEAAREWLRGQRLAPGVVATLQPVAGRLEPARLAAWLLESDLPARLGLQLHKLIWPPGSDGDCLLDLGPGQG